MTLVPLSMVAGALLFPVVGLYRRHVASTSVRDLKTIAEASLLMCLSVAFVWAALPELNPIPRSTFVIQILVSLSMLGAIRVAARRGSWSSIQRTEEGQRKAEIPLLLVGTGVSCDLYLRAILRDPNSTFVPVGILDDSSGTQGLFFHDVPILGSIRDIDNVIATMTAERMEPRKLVLTEPITHFDADAMQKLLKWADRSGVKVSKLPGLGELREMKDPRSLDTQEVDVADILDRPQKVISREMLSRMVKGRRVLVTGAGGSIGSELTRQVASLEPEEIVLIDNCEYNLYAIDMDLHQMFPDVKVRAHMSDIRDRRRVMGIFDQHRPELVFNAAALKHVPMVELNPCEGVLTNVIGARNVADASSRYNALAMVQVSTDKAVNTTNVMGATKRVAEFYCQAQDRAAVHAGSKTRFMTVRFGNVLGSSGSLIPLFQRQISQGGPLTVTDAKMERFFMTIREAVELTLLASAHGLEDRVGTGEIFVLDMGDPVKIIDVAERMIRLAGLRPGVDIDIKIVGIRPGEKLFEELFDENEEMHESPIKGVRAARPNGVRLATLRQTMAELEVAARDGNPDDVIAALASLVPGYKDSALKRLPVKTSENEDTVDVA
ncbi:polysaccharide biosynthesis protein [Actibacterium lipolyticum]|uniref:polysaccharide biosynthesis protein n=1 Tax=Actibacterium lipolyticum TaxID=1524263 RepID=UPI001595632A|nr:nucleoside-diphosphate sugar epimerase/dehydratase [Actibacterium lipolyticum]